MKQLPKLILTAVIATAAVCHPYTSRAQSGTWNVDADGTWSVPGNWLGGIIADGAGNTADFSAVPVTAERTVTLDTSRALGMVNIGEMSLSYLYENFVST